MIPKSAVITPAIRTTRKTERWIPPVPAGTPIPPSEKLSFGTTVVGQLSIPKCGFEHFCPANCAEANQPAV